MIAALLDHLWQSTLFAACAGLLTLALRDNGAWVRYWLWFVASVKFLIPLAVLMVVGDRFILPLAQTASEPALVGAVLHFVQPFSAASPARPVSPDIGLNASSILATIWAAGFAAVMLMWLVRWSRINAAMRSATPLSLTSPLSVPVKISSSILEPGLIGIWRPSILLPAGIETRLSDREMDAIFAHELCHMRRRDNLTAAIHMLVEASFWFCPLVWWLGARLIAEREKACDESVLASGRDPQVYAESILKVCRFYVESPLTCASGVSGADLKKRVEAIMINRSATKLNLARKFLLTASAAITVALPVLGGLMGSHRAAAQMQNGSAPPLPDAPEVVAQRLAEQRKPRTALPLDPKTFDQHGGSYQEESGRVFSIAPAGDHFLPGLFGQENVGVHSQSGSKSFMTAGRLRFMTGAHGGVTEPAAHPGGVERDSRVKDVLEAARQARIANQPRGPDTQELLRRAIDSGPLVKSLGALKSLTFRTANARGGDVYDATFEKGRAEFSIGSAGKGTSLSLARNQSTHEFRDGDGNYRGAH